MADYATQSKVRGTPGYSVPLSPRRRPVTSWREQFHFTSTPHAHRPLVGHDCCNDVIKMAIDDVTPSWTAKLLADQLFAQYPTTTSTTRTADESRQHPENTADSSQSGSSEVSTPHRSARKAVRLLFTLGKRGTGPDDLLYPRAVAIDAETGDVYVADTGNRRIQRYTRYGVHLGAIVAPSGSDKNYFLEPTGVALPAFGSTVVVADRGLSKIMVFTKGPTCADHRLLTSFSTVGPPYCVTYDSEDRIILSTTSGRIEIYDAAATVEMAEAVKETDAESEYQSEKTKMADHSVECRLLGAFVARLNHRSSRLPAALYVSVSAARPETLVVSDPVTSTITWYSYDGRPVFDFKPSYSMVAVKGSTEQHQAFVAAGIDVDAAGQLFVVDRLNGTVCVLNDRGFITRQLVQSSTTGPIQSVAIGPEGHFACVEYQANDGDGSHCVRVYNHRDCSCHGERRK